MKLANGTILYQRVSGTNYTASTVFTNFCPAGGCSTTPFILSITMTDSYGDGWNGNKVGIKQNLVTVGTFGAGFYTGTFSGPVYLTVQSNSEVQVVVNTLGSYTEEVGFIIKSPNDTIIFQRTNGTQFNSTFVFSTFCPGGGCPAPLALNITMVDSYGDGWQGSVLAVRQNNVIVGTFGSNFTTGTSNGPVIINVIGNQEIQIILSNLGADTH